MTREEAIQRLKANRDAMYFPETVKALDMAIEALSAEPKMKVCEERQNGECPFYTPDWLDDDVSEPSDLISRADAIEAVWKLDKEATEYVVDDTHEIHGYCTAIGVCVGELSALPSAEAVQGKWIGYNADKEDWLRTDGAPIFLVCDKCHGTVINNGSAHWNFCPNCGAKMYKGGDD